MKSSSALLQSSLRQFSGSAYDYDFIDSGNLMRLERFASQVIVRPCPSAIWHPKLSLDDWGHPDSVSFTKEGGWSGSFSATDVMVRFGPVIFSIKLSEQGQLGIFPEQQENWKWLIQTLHHNTVKWNASLQMDGKSSNELSPLKVLNGFAYTGGSTLACASVEGVEVLYWSNETMRVCI